MIPGYVVFFFNDPAPPEIYTLSLHDALPICRYAAVLALPTLLRSLATAVGGIFAPTMYHIYARGDIWRSEEHTSELQSLRQLVCRLLLEKQNIQFKTDLTCSFTDAAVLFTFS